MKILLATTSRHKCAEIADLLSDVPDLTLETLENYPATEAPEEDGETMADNARIKAQFYASHFQTTVLADDSGFEVNALNGEPGVHSARWIEGSDENRVNAVLDRMKDVPEEERTARYRCALCLATPEKVLYEVEGTCEGSVGYMPLGENGFGYDPIFQITLGTGASEEYLGQSIAQAPPEVKASISHRANAVRQLAEKLKTAL
jgi:XTP/dITP diphosphohydrolase